MPSEREELGICIAKSLRPEHLDDAKRFAFATFRLRHPNALPPEDWVALGDEIVFQAFNDEISRRWAKLQEDKKETIRVV